MKSDENPLKLKKAHKIRDTWIILFFVPLYLLFGPFALYGDGDGMVLLVILLTVCLGLMNLRGSWKLGIAAILNPMIALPIFYTFQAIFRYLWGQPTLIYCSYLPKPVEFDEAKAVYVKFWNDDCDWNMLYLLSSDLNNWITEGLMGVMGKAGIPHILFFLIFPFLLFFLLRKLYVLSRFKEEGEAV